MKVFICESLVLAGHDDWRLPNAKELQYIVDYSRLPDITHSPAIDPIFNTSSITNEKGQVDYPFFWTSTTHANQTGGSYAVYVSFGRAMGKMNRTWMDVHGAGVQRSDPKTGSASNYLDTYGPQGDAIRIDNYLRCVRGEADFTTNTEVISESQSASQVSSTTPGGTPPQIAQDACSGRQIGDSCSFQALYATKSGMCDTVAGVFACKP